MNSKPVFDGQKVFRKERIFCIPCNVFSEIFGFLVDPALFENQIFTGLICFKKLLLGKGVFVVEVNKGIIPFDGVLFLGFIEFDKDDGLSCFFDLF